MSNEPAPVVRARGLGVRTGSGRDVLRDVDLDVARGDRVAVLGPSGAGKSLLLRALLGALPPSATRTGDVAVSSRTAWVQQDPSRALHPSVAVGRQLARPLRRAGAGRREAGARVAEALAAVALDPADVVDALPGRLSGGERQRVCVALAVLTGADALLADEPTTALDTVSQAQVLAAVRRVAGAVVLVTHDVAVAAALCDRAVVLDDGAVVEQGPLDRLLVDPRHPVTQELVRLAPGRAAEHRVGAA